MTREEIVAKLIEFASIAFEKDAAGITEETDIAAELGVKSVQRVSMAASIENEFDVMVPVARFDKFKTIGDFADFIMDEM